MIKYEIYVDGSCRGNKNGGIGIIWIRNEEKVFEYSKGFRNVTNNIMELTAIEFALASINKPIDSLEIISDSEYALGCIFDKSWNPKKNVKLINKIKEILNSTQSLVKEKIKYRHVDGHQRGNNKDVIYNNRADELAQKESKNIIL